MSHRKPYRVAVYCHVHSVFFISLPEREALLLKNQVHTIRHTSFPAGCNLRLHCAVKQDPYRIPLYRTIVCYSGYSNDIPRIFQGYSHIWMRYFHNFPCWMIIPISKITTNRPVSGFGSRAHISAAFSPRSQMSPLNKKRLDGEGTPTWPWPWPWRRGLSGSGGSGGSGKAESPKKNMGSLGNHGDGRRHDSQRSGEFSGVPVVYTSPSESDLWPRP